MTGLAGVLVSLGAIVALVLSGLLIAYCLLSPAAPRFSKPDAFFERPKPPKANP